MPKTEDVALFMCWRGEKKPTLQIRFCRSLKTLAQEMLKRKYFYLLSEKNMRELILGGINPDVLPASM